MAARRDYDLRDDDVIRVLVPADKDTLYTDGARVGDFPRKNIVSMITKGRIEVMRDGVVVAERPADMPSRPFGRIDPWESRAAQARVPGSIYDNPPPKTQKQRKCIRCGTMFLSDHAGHRFCVSCAEFARGATGYDE
ncbi:MAG: hypothetical protein JNJ73_02005 [Hyphomonadaceae bacterium]|nr:hypothetical protein [Hyphomonadaceae bacterium]